MTKTPFDKIRSLVERRKLFEQVIAQQGEITCKGSDESLFLFKPTAMVEGDFVQGTIVSIEKMPSVKTDLVGNFAVGTDRYFFTGVFASNGTQGAMNVNCDIFLLQRRASFRLSVRPQLGLFMAVIEFQGTPLYLIAHVADISAGGAKVYFGESHSTSGITGTSKDPGLKAGSRFKAVIHPPSGKNLEVLCEVKHVQRSVVNDQMVDQFGVEFVGLDHRVKNRLMAMTMDLQQKLIQADN